MTSPTQSPAPPSRSNSSRGLLAPSFTLLRVRGIRIGAHWSWLFVFALFCWTLARNLFPRAFPGLTGRDYLVMAFVSAVLFFVCILLHELGHAFRALKEQMKITDITLWLFGGVARFEGMFPSAGAEFRIAAAGPLVSVLLAGAFAVLTWAGGMADLPVQILAVCDYLARINVALVVFNLVPALPLDGGRILRAYLWNRKGNFTRATVAAARVGKGFAYVLMAFGVFQFFGSTANGIWFVVMGWFLLSAAQAEQNFAVVRQAFQDLNVRGIMTPNPVVVPSTMNLDDFLRLVESRGHSTYPVVDDEVLKGVVSLRMAAGVPVDRRARTSTSEVMAQPIVLSGWAPVVDVIDLLREPPGRAVVVDGGRVSGILSISDVLRALEIRQSRNEQQEQGRRLKLGIVWGAVAVLLPIAAALYRPPVVVVSPAPAIDVTRDIEIDGVPVTRPSGRYMLVAVHVVQPNGITAALASLNPNVDVLPRETLLPPGVSHEEYLEYQKDVFVESQQSAAAAAARAVGLEVTLSGVGAQIIDVLADSPADGNLRVGDVVVAVDGTPIRLVSDLTGLTTTRPAGTVFEFTVERDSRTRTVEVESAPLPGFNQANVGIGIVSTTKDLDVDLPFDVEFKERPIGGPSAGLIYALAIADMLDPDDIAQQRRVAASGTIQLTGGVGAVGGLEEKLESAEEADVDIFLVPSDELGEVAGTEGESRVTTLGVESLEDALSVLRNHQA
ncbi:MAG TPA: site-2 protease family protein [Actinomycetota bacterium]|nr:site-2 protease family protein [Actinomycetota bacterium]